MYDSFRKEILDRHDVYANHKYEERFGYTPLPYSFHLIATESIAEKFIEPVFGKEYMGVDTTDRIFQVLIKCVAISHDCLEDARMTYGDLKKSLMSHFGDSENFCETVAMACFRLCDEKGLTRKERKNKKYYDELTIDVIATYIKLCDRLANIMYGKLMGGTMIGKYKKENPEFISKLYNPIFKPLFEEISLQLRCI